MKSSVPPSKMPTTESICDSKCIDSEVSQAFSTASSEMEAVFQQGMTLESQGKLDAAATELIEARLHEISTKLEKDLATQVSRTNKSYALQKPWLLPKPYRVPAIIALLFICVGVLLEITRGAGFIFSGSNAYRDAMPWMFGALIPVFAVGWGFLLRANHGLRAYYPTGFVRWFVMFPSVVTVFSAMVVFSPLGWFALLGWAIGSPAEHVEIRVISVDRLYSHSRGCDQTANLEFAGVVAQICLEGRLSGKEPQAGEKVLASGRLSRLGLFIGRIDHQ